MTYPPVCTECDKISRLPISCVNYTFINKVSHIHIKLTYDLCQTIYLYIKLFYIHIKFAGIHSCQNNFPLPMQLCLYQADFFIFDKKIHVKLTLTFLWESENQPYIKQHMVATNLFIPERRRVLRKLISLRLESLYCHNIQETDNEYSIAVSQVPRWMT